MTERTLTLSVVSHGQANLVAKFLDDLRRLAPPSVAQVLLTINLPEEVPSTENLPFPVEVLINPRSLGFAANHNQAFRYVKTDHFAVVNPDIRLKRDPFGSLLSHLEEDDVGVISPVVLEPNGLVADFARVLITPWESVKRRIHHQPSTRGLARYDWLAGMFMAFRTETYLSLGGFDERYTLYCEDVDICARIRLSGKRVVIAREVEVVHHAQRASHYSLRPLRLHTKSLLKLWTSPAYREYRKLIAREAMLATGDE
jgi:N-acetylglucosaminyl-diphospho-decaprenol L-rhamnosyltransferase